MATVELKNVTRHDDRLSFEVFVAGEFAGLADLWVDDAERMLGGSGDWLELEGVPDDVAELAEEELKKTQN